MEGPAESRYGYACPTVVDWDGDGDLDLIMSDATARQVNAASNPNKPLPCIEPRTLLGAFWAPRSLPTP
jgi:hypothetical protein